MRLPDPLPYHAYRDPALVLEEKQEREASERERQAKREGRKSPSKSEVARKGLERLFGAE